MGTDHEAGDRKPIGRSDSIVERHIENGLPEKMEGVVVCEIGYIWPVEVRKAPFGMKEITKAEIEYRMKEVSIHTPLLVWYNENKTEFGIRWVDREKYKPLNTGVVRDESGRFVLPVLAELSIEERRALIDQIINHFRSTHACGYLLDLNVVSRQGVRVEDLGRFCGGEDRDGEWMYDVGEEEGVSAIPFGFQEKDREEEEKLATYIGYQLARLVAGGQFEEQIRGLAGSLTKVRDYKIKGVVFREELLKILDERAVNGIPQIVEVLRRRGYDQIAETIGLVIRLNGQDLVNDFVGVGAADLKEELERLGREKTRLRVSGMNLGEVDGKYPRAETEWQTAHREALEEKFMNELDQLAAIVAIIAGGGYDPAVIVPLVKKLDVRGEYDRAVGETEVQMATRWQAVGKVYLYIEEFGNTQLERVQRK